MKKIIVFIAFIVLLFILSGCTVRASVPKGHRPPRGIITYGTNGVYYVDIDNYTRISSGWMAIKTTDGRVFHTNEKNVLIIEQE